MGRPYTWESTIIVFLFLLILLGLNLFFGLIQILVSEPLIFSPILIIGELFFLAVVVAWVAVRRLPWQATFYLYKTSWVLVGLGILLAIVWWPVAVGLGVLMEQIFSLIGPPPEIPAPRNTLDAIGYVVAIVILAPLCEEPIFRGFVLRGWLRFGLMAGVVGSGTLFGLQHGQLAGLLSLCLVGIVLGIVALRAGSLIPAVVLHAVYNGLAVPFLVAPDSVPDISDSTFLVAGAIFTPVALFTLWLYYRFSPSGPSVRQAPPDRNQTVATIISFLMVLVMFTGIALLEILVRLNPELSGT